MAYKRIVRKKMKGSSAHFIAGMIAALLILSVVSMVPSVKAQPPPPVPQLYKGYVRLNGHLVPHGINVSIYNESDHLIKTCWTFTYEGQQGYYTIMAEGNYTDPDGIEHEGFKDGENITFKIGSLTADQNGTWHEGTGKPIGLDLWANTSSSGGDYTSSTGDLHDPEINATWSDYCRWNSTRDIWEVWPGAEVTMKANVTINLSATVACEYRNLTMEVVYNNSWGIPMNIIVSGGGTVPIGWEIKITNNTSGTTADDKGWYVNATIVYHSIDSGGSGQANPYVTFKTTAPTIASKDGKNGTGFFLNCTCNNDTVTIGTAIDFATVDAIPEFSTLLIPVIGTIFLFFIMRKKYKK